MQFYNPHLQYLELLKRGYGVIDITKLKTQFEYYYIDDVADSLINEFFVTAFFVNHNEKCVNKTSIQTDRVRFIAYHAPVLPYNHPLDIQENSDFILFGAFPNPTTDF
jgi:hypothetical protein